MAPDPGSRASTPEIDLSQLNGLSKSKAGKPLADAIERAVGENRMTYLLADGSRAAAIVPLEVALALDPARPAGGSPANAPLHPLPPEPRHEPAGAGHVS